MKKLQNWDRSVMQWLAGGVVLLVPIAAGVCLSPPATASSSGISFRAVASSFSAPTTAVRSADVTSESTKLDDWTYTIKLSGSQISAFNKLLSSEIIAFSKEESAEAKAFGKFVSQQTKDFYMTHPTHSQIVAFNAMLRQEGSDFGHTESAEAIAFFKAIAAQIKTFYATGVASPAYVAP